MASFRMGESAAIVTVFVAGVESNSIVCCDGSVPGEPLPRNCPGAALADFWHLPIRRLSSEGKLIKGNYSEEILDWRVI